MVSLWDALCSALWLAGIGLTVIDAGLRWGYLGHLAVFGMMLVVIAAVMTVSSVIRHAKEEVLAQMDKAFELGQESVRRLHR